MPRHHFRYAKLERCEAEKLHAEQQLHLLKAKIGPLQADVLDLRARLGFAEAEVSALHATHLAGCLPRAAPIIC